MSDPTLAKFLSLFTYSNSSVNENFSEVNIKLEGVSCAPLNLTDFTNALQFLNERDDLHISISIEDGEPIDFYCGNDASAFIDDLSSRYSIIENESIVITIKIIKNQKDGVVSIYCRPEFLHFIEELSTQTILNDFHQLLVKSNYVIFEYQVQEPITTTKSISFVNKGAINIPAQIERASIINSAKTSCHYNFLAKSILVAEDFSVLHTECQRMGDLLNKLSSILSIVYLFDITSIQNSSLEYRLNGYKSITGIVDLKSINMDPDRQYFKIFSWVYNSGNFIDKLGLARNIISLHIESSSTLELKGDPYRSIQSSYKVYEKQNIKQYIEIRNKISDQLLGLHDRANKVIENFATGFQKSAFALITFYISAVILKVLNKDKLVEVFTIDAAILSTSFIGCSVLYFFVQRWEVNAQASRFKANYEDIKKRFTDLLDEQDIKRILNDDNEFNKDVKFIEDKKTVYTKMWFGFLAIFFISTWLIYFVYNPISWYKIQILFERSPGCICLWYAV
ncbi:hypothetical protein [Chitinophaga caseinilytica]|uniref:hypothetical protein n=1 Tax=Chitinophaga caseinilytica TaxID=2267521 RepID=UPI003C2CB4A1